MTLEGGGGRRRGTTLGESGWGGDWGNTTVVDEQDKGIKRELSEGLQGVWNEGLQGDWNVGHECM